MTPVPTTAVTAIVELPPIFTPILTIEPQPTQIVSSTATLPPTNETPIIIPTNTPIPLPPTEVPATAVPPTPAANDDYTLSPAPVAVAPPSIYETTVTIPTYGYESGFQPTLPEDIIYPYPRLNFNLVGPLALRTYQAVILENGFVSVTILPELGGRIYRWVDKATGRQLLYNNPVVKPTNWGYRGWWLSAGGIEWAFPVEDHGLNEYRPWNHTVESTEYGQGVTVSNVEDRTGMEVGATISLGVGHAYLTIQPWARNNTAEAHPFQLWLNALVTLGGNAISDQTQFIIPAGEVIIHSTTDSGVPPSGSSMSWPFYGGRDISWYRNWAGYLGFFAPVVSHGFTGIYDHAVDQGIVRSYSPGWPAGTKIFGPGTLSPAHWTDGNSSYIELWSGATSSFWSNGTLNPGESFGWAEYWYPVHGIGGFTYANRTAALKLIDTGSGAEVGVAVSGGVSGVINLYAGGQLVAH